MNGRRLTARHYDTRFKQFQTFKRKIRPLHCLKRFITSQFASYLAPRPLLTHRILEADPKVIKTRLSLEKVTLGVHL